MSYRPFIVATALVCALAAPEARADIPPPDSCDNLSAGQACNNAGPNYDQPGTCTQSTCQRVDPLDGGTIEYSCLRCMEGSAGAGGAGAGGAASGGAAGGSAAGAAGTKPSVSTSEDESGCSFAAAPREGIAASLLLLVGAGALLLSRRRRC